MTVGQRIGTMAGLQKSMKKYEKSQEIRALHTEQCCLFMLAGVRSTLTLAQKIGGIILRPIEPADWS